MNRARRAGLAIPALLMLAGCWEAPPMDTEQIGFRGVGMVEVSNPDITDQLRASNTLPEPLPLANADGPRAGDIYENVQVLGHLSVGEFTRTMQAITNWVSPEQGCAYCHVGNNFADDDLYTKMVSRRMMQMTFEINANWQDHVGSTGVNCYTCHRGQNVPQYIWFTQPEDEGAAGFAANNFGHNDAQTENGSHSMLGDPFAKYLEADQARIRVIAQTALPIDGMGSYSSTQETENTYSLMFHMSNSLGQNCTYCHNSRHFASWYLAPPARVTSWHALRMVPALNAEYLEPLGPVYPDFRLGPLGDAPKVNCTTCHQGVAKPLYGESMMSDYPEWMPPGGEGYEPVPIEAMTPTTTSLDAPRTDDDRRASLDASRLEGSEERVQ